ncbi:hypothetical protein RRG08_028981 [Elysia crispata]|uniref:Uncharacterized protein n=1 Tax=Elysia crispata TaxID=231223 RepID=A0AAE1BDD7_9GAST|nr:hypothetical protein RRG08_028981 [Elysia crispata]
MYLCEAHQRNEQSISSTAADSPCGFKVPADLTLQRKPAATGLEGCDCALRLEAGESNGSQLPVSHEHPRPGVRDGLWEDIDGKPAGAVRSNTS